jgi:hypothetical protein
MSLFGLSTIKKLIDEQEARYADKREILRLQEVVKIHQIELFATLAENCKLKYKIEQLIEALDEKRVD